MVRSVAADISWILYSGHCVGSTLRLAQRSNFRLSPNNTRSSLDSELDLYWHLVLRYQAVRGPVGGCSDIRFTASPHMNRVSIRTAGDLMLSRLQAAGRPHMGRAVLGLGYPHFT